MEQILLSVQMYVLTLVMTPFGFVVLPHGIGMLKEHTELALCFYTYLLMNPVLFRTYLRFVRRRRGDHPGSACIKRALWLRGLLWTLLSHFVIYELLFLANKDRQLEGITAKIGLVALSSIALVVLGACTGILSYRYVTSQKEHFPQQSPVSRGNQ